MEWGIVVALIPALLWGINPTIVGKIKAKSIQQQLGTTLGASFFALVVFFCTMKQSINDLQGDYLVLLIPFLSGFFWSIGQLFQYKSFLALGTSTGFALGTGLNLVLNALFSCLVFREWQTGLQYGLGFGAIAVIIVGCFLNSYTVKKEKKDRVTLLKGLLIVLVADVFLVLYADLPKMVTMKSVQGTSTLLPQAFGMIVGTFLLVLVTHLLERRKKKAEPEFEMTQFFEKKTWLSTIVGLSFGGANIGLIYANQMVGNAIGFTLSQTCVAFSTIFAFLFLKDYQNKTKKELILTILGVLLIVGGCVMIGFAMR